ncbi:interaptin [Teleopsis dalmanni]|uniref:interaptin n=1 Tax=Teleopsis dalmanni TaxID=139649 RepID=UPI0018CC848B|nr:interaptin [Teleopsis dalmanni]
MLKLNFDNEGSNHGDFFGNLDRRSNLDELFDSAEETEDQNLKYKRTKQPHSEPTSTATGTQAQAWKTELALVATAYKADASMGKVGVALLRDATNNFRVIIYKTKTSILSNLNVKKEDQTNFYMQNNYIQFYDESMIFWSLNFDKHEDRQAFIDKLNFFNIKVEDKPEIKTQTEIIEKVKESPVIIMDDKVDESPKGKNNTRTSLLSRISKVGQQLPIFPKSDKITNNEIVTTTEYSDSSDAEVVATPLIVTNKPTIAPKSKTMSKLTNNQIVAANSTSFYGNNTQFNAMETQFLQMMLTENRTQNTEMRMVINKLESKIEKVMDKVDGMSTGGNQKTNKDDEIIALEEKLLELKKENRKLKQTLDNNSQRINEESFHNLLKIYADDFEDLGIKPIKDLEKVFNDLIEKSKQFQKSNIKNESSVKEEMKKSQLLEQELETERESHKIIKKKLLELENTLENLKQSHMEKEIEVETLNQKLVEQLEAQQNKTQQEKTQTEIVLKIMNNLYGSLSTKMDDLDVLQKEQIIAIIGQTIREESLKVIRK